MSYTLNTNIRADNEMSSYNGSAYNFYKFANIYLDCEHLPKDGARQFFAIDRQWLPVPGTGAAIGSL